MSKVFAIPAARSSLVEGKKPDYSAAAVDLARFNFRRHYTAKEFAAALNDLAGISIGERAVVRRCRLPAVDPARIATNPAFTGRHYIPGAELARLAGVEVSE